MKKNDLKAFKEYLKKLEKKEKSIPEFYEYACRQIALRFLGNVIPDTPVQENKTVEYLLYGKPKTAKIRGGALRRGWIGEVKSGPDPTPSEINNYINTLSVSNNGKSYSITIINSVKYAVFVEEGHRQNIGQFVPILGKRLVSGFVPGQHMMKNAVKNVERMEEGLLKKLAREFFEE